MVSRHARSLCAFLNLVDQGDLYVAFFTYCWNFTDFIEVEEITWDTFLFAPTTKHKFASRNADKIAETLSNKHHPASHHSSKRHRPNVCHPLVAARYSLVRQTLPHDNRSSWNHLLFHTPLLCLFAKLQKVCKKFQITWNSLIRRNWALLQYYILSLFLRFCCYKIVEWNSHPKHRQCKFRWKFLIFLYNHTTTEKKVQWDMCLLPFEQSVVSVWINIPVVSIYLPQVQSVVSESILHLIFLSSVSEGEILLDWGKLNILPNSRRLLFCGARFSPLTLS